GSSPTPRAGSHSEPRRRASGSAEDDADAVCRAVVRERDAGAGQRLIVERDGRDSTRHPARVLDCYLVARRAIAERDLDAAPRAGGGSPGRGGSRCRRGGTRKTHARRRRSTRPAARVAEVPPPRPTWGGAA